MNIEAALAFIDALVFTKTKVHLSDLQQAMLRESWSWQRQSYEQIADTYGYSATYLKHDVGPKLWNLLSEILEEKVNKKNFRAAIERRFQAEDTISLPGQNKQTQFELSTQPPELTRSAQSPENQVIAAASHQDWGEAVDVSFFYGRQQELAQLEQWVIGDRCRLVAILGMGGMGKTSLSVKLAQNLQNHFEWVIWRSLRNAPSIQEILTEWLQILLRQQELDFPESFNGKLSCLLRYLRLHRCLLVLDNVETILQGSVPSSSNTQSLPDRSTGKYREGYQGYAELFRQLGETIHQSCLVLTSREKPQEIIQLEGVMLPIRSLQLGGLKKTEGQELLRLNGSFQGSEADWNRLIDGYAGNPLALKIISMTIQNLFGGSISDFLKQDTLVFGNIRDLLNQQFECLSTLEKTVIYWLAIYREPTSFFELQTDIFPARSPSKLIEVLESLEQRSLIEKVKSLLSKNSVSLFLLQPVVMEYVTERLIEQICQEIQTDINMLVQEKNLLLKSHALMKAQAKDYIRETQARFILNPIIERLLTDVAGKMTFQDLLIQLLASLRNKTLLETGYAGGNILNLLCQRQTCLSAYDFSHLTIWQAYLQQVNLHDINFANTDLSQSVFAETLGIVFAVAFSPDGTLLATGDAEGGLWLWQVTTGKLLGNFAGHLGWVWSVAFSADSQILASCSSDKTIRLWNANTGECLKILLGHTSSIWSVALSADGYTLASGGEEPIVRLWDVNTGESRKLFAGHTGRILSVAFSPDGQILASGSGDRTIRLWSVSTGQCLHVCDGHTERVWSVTFSADGATLVSGSADHTLRLWSVKTGQCLKIFQEHGVATNFPEASRVRSIALSPNGQMLVSASDDHTVRVWSVSTGECLNILRGHTNSVFSVAFNTDGQTLASGSIDQTVRLWNVHTGRCFKTLKGYTNSVYSVAFNVDGQTLVSGSTDQTVRIWNVNTGTCLKVLTGHHGWVTSVAFHPQGQVLASSSVDRTIRLWSVSTGQCLQILQGHANWVQSVAWSPDSQILASGSDDQTIRLWSVSTRKCLKILQGHTSWIWAVTFSPDGQLLASSSDDQTIRLWSVHTGQCLQILQGHTSQVQSIAFSPDGQILSSASGDETVRLWSVSMGQCLKIFQGHSNNVWSVSFSPDGKILASGSLDQTVRLWEVSTGTCLKILPVLTHSVRSAIAFSPVATPAKHHTLAIGNQDGTIQICDAQTGECLQTLSPDKPYKGTNITNVTGLRADQKLTLKTLGAIEDLVEIEPVV